MSIRRPGHKVSRCTSFSSVGVERPITARTSAELLLAGTSVGTGLGKPFGAESGELVWMVNW